MFLFTPSPPRYEILENTLSSSAVEAARVLIDYDDGDDDDDSVDDGDSN